MKSIFVAIMLTSLVICACGQKASQQKYPYRWTYMSRGLSNDKQVEDVAKIARICAQNGLNGILFSCGADRLDIQSSDYVRRLKEVKKICDDLGVDIIPSIFSVGYGGTGLAHNKNLAAGIPVEEALFVVKGGEAVHLPDPQVKINNGGFEVFKGGRASGFDSPETYGLVISRDTETRKDGKSSLRFEDFGKHPEEAGRLSTEIEVKPHRLYRMSCWIKSEGMDESKPFSSGNLRFQATAPDKRPLEWMNINMPASGDWVRVVEAFNSREYEKVRISIYASSEQQGRFWVDGLEVEEMGMVNLLRRPGTPVTVRGETSGVVYEEGRDFDKVIDPELDFRFEHDGPAIKLLPGSRIAEGERLLVSFYHGTYVYDGQVTLCMSEPELYDIWRANASLMQQQLGSNKYFLHMDEIRNGGACKACMDRNLPMHQILGDCITKAHAMLREVNPEAEIFIWSDMIDPIHNGSDRRSYYYHVAENYYGSWNYIPKDLIISCWWHKMRNESLAHFSGLGYRTIGASYYDADDLENPKEWLESLDKTPGASGIIYTTWLRKYDLLDDFGKLVSEHWN
ncbi:hypothetical protein ACFL4P_00530 [Gemmatimonadota bacterium]